MFTFDEDCVSDLHKDAFGFRPSQSWWYGWTHATDAQKQLNWDSMVEAMVLSEEKRVEEEKCAVDMFEARVQTVIESGAGNRETAIRWLVAADGCTDDMDYFSWKNGLPYDYFKKI